MPLSAGPSCTVNEHRLPTSVTCFAGQILIHPQAMTRSAASRQKDLGVHANDWLLNPLASESMEFACYGHFMPYHILFLCIIYERELEMKRGATSGLFHM